MNKKSKGRMGDEEPLRRQMLRRPKIIIRKCKKSEPTPKTVEEDCKKVNGELSTETKGKEDTSNNALEIKVLKQKPPASKNTVTIRSTRKRKLSDSANQNKVVILDDDTPTIIEEKKSNGNDVKHDSAPVEFKGFKKRILAQTEKLKEDTVNDNNQSKDSESVPPSVAESDNHRQRVGKVTKSKKKTTSGKKGNDADGDENQGESQTEYAQYLGLQPTMQFKCYRCGERGFPSMLALNMHQRGCGVQKDNFIANLQQDTSSFTPSDPNMLTNFRITRKVYLCSACGTYYENWNLFLHMRDVHKKHICLFCLTMFGTADKLADHLKSIHNVLETTFQSSEEFQNSYKGSCYLICCICENMFSEREEYFHHHCEKRDPTAKCNLCGVKCGHYYTCPNSNSQRNVPAINKAPTNKGRPAEEIWMGKKGQGDMYDISDAASFCHVALADDSLENEKNVSHCNLINVTAVSDEVLNVEKPAIEEPQSIDLSENVDNNNMKQPDNQSEDIENEVDNHGSTHESVFSEKSPTEVTLSKEQNILSKGNESPEERPIELIEDNCESVIKDKNDTNKECNDLEEINKQSSSSNKNIDEPHTESDVSKEPISEYIHSEEKAEVEETVNEQQFEEVKSDDKSHSYDNSEKAEGHVELSDSDTHPNSQDDSESSTDESTEDECKKRDEESIEDPKKDLSENDDNVTSESVIDDKTKNLNNDSENSEKLSVTDTTKEKDSPRDTNDAELSDTSKDFHLDDVSSNEKDVDEKENDNVPTVGVAEDLPESSSPVASDGIPLAGEDVPAMALTLEDKLEEASSQSVVKECVRTSCLNCVYCSHAIKIAVNGKQLALHLLAEHRYKPVKNNETSQDVIKKLKASLNELEPLFFNTDSYDSSDKSLNSSYDYTYECFQCRFVTKVHKELYIHKRKMHQKTVLLCVMCKSNFYSYSELLCHMCPGIYVSEDIYFRCCFCNLDMIPSAFRLMVHLRKGHHTCDICLEIAGDQQKLSTHMWKHKLNHLCYRCGIAYRNKPDITKHLFWKHGTESVLCKKCLQKKWPHVYHFCIPPTVFICEECDASFTKAVALKVHKRFHSGEFPYVCDQCNQKFVSRKLLSKHEDSHNQLPLSERYTSKNDSDNKQSECNDEHINVESIDEPSVGDSVVDKKDNSLAIPTDNNDKTEIAPKSKKRKKRDRDSKPVLDVYDLPPLNLSSESDSSDEETNHTSETLKEKQESDTAPPLLAQVNNESQFEFDMPENAEPCEENQTPAPIVDGVWDNFHSYKAELEKRESKDLSLPNILPSTSEESRLQPEAPPEIEPPKSFLLDHSYCLIPGKSKPTDEEVTLSEQTPVDEAPAEEPQETPAPRGHSSSIDHPYATMNSSSADGALVSALPLDQKPSTPPPLNDSIAESHSSSKKKQKTPKKKKHTANSSSSSDSSSDSDSTDCTCGTNCSCSNTSSSTSSSSSSSDSDSSTSEGRRKAAARKEKKKERLKHKHHKEEPPPVPAIPPPPPLEEEPVVDVPVEELELPIKESDLDTDESSTDEDFYDKYPQSHARQQLEKRNKLMLLASVAPVNNGTVSPPPPPPPTVEETPAPQQPPPPATKRKIKTKRRRKSQSKKSIIKTNLTHNEPSTSLNVPTATSTPSHILSNHQNIAKKAASPLRTSISAFHSDATAGSGSENESARLSKRKRVRNKFYGYSSEEEENEKSNLKWRKVEPAPVAPSLNFQPALTIQRPQLLSVSQVKRPESSDSSGTEEETVIKKPIYSNTSSSNSSDSENEMDSKENVQKEQTEKSDNLYCYCQCPYDEVSEMIACDGQDCTIEWFHFECVGIMVPPKGKWYCPDCRKRRDMM